MKRIYHNHRRWAMLLFLFVCLPFNIHAQTKAFEMVVEKTDGTELSFRITEDYPLLQFQYGGDEGINTIEIQTASGYTSVPCPLIKRLHTREYKPIPGDASGNNDVDAGDVVAITDYMIGKEPEKFNIEAADMNGDNVFNIADIILIVNKIFESK